MSVIAESGIAASAARDTKRRNREGFTGGIRSSLVIARRNLMKIRGEPALLLDATLMPMVFATMFVFVFGGAIAGTQHGYAQYFIPGIMALTVTIVARTTGIGMAVDLSNGIVDRFRSLPISRTAVLSGRVFADAARTLISVLVTLLFSLVIGFRVHSSALGVLGCFALLVMFGIGVSWMCAFIGLQARSVQAVETITTLALMPLQFGSSLFVPPKTMPGWLQPIITVNPMTQVVNASRGLLVGGPVAHPLALSAGWIALLLLVFVPLSVRRYRTRS